MVDLTIPEGVQEYLAKTPFAASSVVALSGGLANFTYRITLRDPYTPPGLDVPVKTLVMKHAEPYVAAYKNMPFAVERQEFERQAFKLIPELVAPMAPILGLPKLYYQDPTNGVMLISDSGPDCRTLKAVLQNGPLSDELARDIGAALGTFIARLHTATRNPAPGTLAQTTKEAFATNHQARSIVGSMTYGGILSIFTEDPPLLSPPLTLSPEVLAKLAAFARKAEDRTNTSSDVLVVGDFWTGNTLLVLEPVPHITVIDWEAARPGFPGMDLGQFLAELHLLRVFHPNSRACVDIIVAALTGAYRGVSLENGNREDVEPRLADTAHDAAARLGTHLITITPRIHWGGPELTREVVQQGVEYVLRSVDGDEAWLKSSLVGGLWG